MNAIGQLGLFDKPSAIELAERLPEWFGIGELASSLGFNSHFDPEFQEMWYSNVLPRLEERKKYIAGTEHSGNYRGYIPVYKLSEKQQVGMQ